MEVRGMSIGSKIKQRRTELNMSQEALAEKIGVSRSAVSNWESERNYPDLQIIVSLSEILDIPLDSLLKDDAEVIEKIATDTKQRKKLSAKVKILYAFSAALFIAVCALLYFTRYQEISDASKIKTVQLNGEGLVVSVDIPKYRSLCGWYMDWGKDGKTITVSLITKRDLSFYNQSVDVIPLIRDDKPERIVFVYNNQPFATYNADDIRIN